MDSPINDRLKALGLVKGMEQRTPPAPKPQLYTIDKVIPGDIVGTPLGETFSTRRTFFESYRHGNVALSESTDLSLLAEWAHIPHLNQMDLEKILFLDTETSGLAGGTGTYAFMIGLGFFEHSNFHVVQLFMRDPSEEPATLLLFQNWLESFDCLVTFNGKSFDVPLLRTRFSMNLLPDTLANLPQVDLLHLARKIWKNRLASRALADLEIELLGVQRAEDEVPGYLIPQLYFDYLRSADARPLAGVFYHNAMDIVSMAALLSFVSRILIDPKSPLVHNLDAMSLAKMMEELGRLEDAASLYEHCIENGLPQQFLLQTLERYALMRKKQGLAQSSILLWERAASFGHLPAYVEIAKYYEHYMKDPKSALDWVIKAYRLIDQTPMPGYQRKLQMEDFNHREQRLRKKLSGQTNAEGEVP